VRVWAPEPLAEVPAERVPVVAAVLAGTELDGKLARSAGRKAPAVAVVPARPVSEVPAVAAALLDC
jgi:hypothetical protein